jgi:hypothetical protein
VQNSDGENYREFPVRDLESALLRGRALRKGGFEVTLRDGSGSPVTLDENERYVRVGRSVLTHVAPSGVEIRKGRMITAPSSADGQSAVPSCLFVEDGGTVCTRRATTRGYCDKHYQRIRDRAIREGTWEGKAGKRSHVTMTTPPAPLELPAASAYAAGVPDDPARVAQQPPPRTLPRDTAPAGYTTSWRMLPGETIRHSVVEFTTQVPLTVAILLEEQAQQYGLDLGTLIGRRFERLLRSDDVATEERAERQKSS